jgi:hypothetical protein
MKTSELTGPALDWAVAKCAGWETVTATDNDGAYVWLQKDDKYRSLESYRPSTNWAQGGPIIERERINIRPNQADAHFKAFVIISPTGLAHRHDGPTPLIAAMRCLVASKLGDDVSIPEELT